MTIIGDHAYRPDQAGQWQTNRCDRCGEPKTAHAAYAWGCPCSCCENRANQLAHGRDYAPGGWCSCAGHERHEQCDCPPCLAVIR